MKKKSSLCFYEIISKYKLSYLMSEQAEKDIYFSVSLKSYIGVLISVNSVLSKKNTCLQEKQVELEKLGHFYNKKLKKVYTSLPKSIKSYMDKLDEMAAGDRTVEHTAAFIHNKFSDDKKKVYKARDAKEIFFKEWVFFLQLCRYLNNSFGLMITHLLAKAVRNATSDFEETNLPHVSKEYFYISKTRLLAFLTAEITSLHNFYMQMALKLIRKKIEQEELLSEIEKLIYKKFDEHKDSNGLYFWKSADIEKAGIISQLSLYLSYSGFFEESLLGSQDSVKNTRFYKLSIEIYNSLIEIGNPMPNLPCVCSPKDWVYSDVDKSKDKSSMNIHSGGYLSGKLYPAFIMKNHMAIANATKEEVDNINYLQSIPFRVSKGMLTSILEAPHTAILGYVYNAKTLPANFCIFEKSADKMLRVFTCQEFINNDDLLKADKMKLLDDSLNKDSRLKIENQIERSIIDLQQKYKSLINKLNLFIFTVEYALLVEDFDLFFPICMDFRGRIYYNSFPLSLQSHSFVNSLLDIKNNVDSLTPNAELEAYYFGELKEEPENFHFYKKNNKIHISHIGLDVSCSGIQIISALLGYTPGLIDTNFIDKSSEKEINSKKDLYENFLDYFLDNYPKTYRIDLKKSHKEKVIAEQNECHDYNKYNVDVDASYPVLENNSLYSESEDNFQPNDNLAIDQRLIDDLLKAFVPYFTRKSIKNWIMCIVYSEGSRSRALKLMEFFRENKPYFFKACNNEKLSMDKNLRKVVYAVSYFLGAHFEMLFYKKYVLFKSFISLVLDNVLDKRLISKNKGVWLCSSDNALKSFYCEFVYNSKKYDTTVKGYLRTQFVFKTITDKVDIQMFKRSIIPNFIHYLDSRILNKVVHYCRVHKIPIYVNHDCFYVHSFHGKSVKTFYFAAVREEILCNDVISYFLKTNGVCINEHKAFLDDINKNKKNILKSIEEGVYKQGRFILS